MVTCRHPHLLQDQSQHLFMEEADMKKRMQLWLIQSTHLRVWGMRGKPPQSAALRRTRRALCLQELQHSRRLWRHLWLRLHHSLILLVKR